MFLTTLTMSSSWFLLCLVAVWIGASGISLGFQLLPVYDVRTEERLEFPEEYLRWYFSQQSNGELASQPLDNQGYIINERGQLIPFRVYKKEGYTMCNLNPRNCRAYHKRLVEMQPRPYISTTRPIQKRGRDWLSQRKVTIPQPIYSLGNDDIFDPGYDNILDDDNSRTASHRETLEQLKDLRSRQISPYPISDPRYSTGDYSDFTTFASSPHTKTTLQTERDEMRLLSALQQDLENGERGDLISEVSSNNQNSQEEIHQRDDDYDYMSDIVRQSLVQDEPSKIVIPNRDVEILEYNIR